MLQGLRAERSLHEEDDVELMDALRIDLAQQNNAPHVYQSSQRSTLRRLLKRELMARRIQSEFWNTTEELVQKLELTTEFHELMNELRLRNRHTDVESNLETSPVNHRESSERRSVNPVDKKIQDTSMQSGSNGPRNDCLISIRETPVPQAGSSRIRLENILSPIQDSTIHKGGNSPKKNDPIKNRNRQTPQAGPSRIRQVYPVDPMSDTSSLDEDSSPSNNASVKVLKKAVQQTGLSRISRGNPVAPYQDSSSQDEGHRKNFAQQAGSSHNQDENLADQVNVSRNYKSLTNPDMVSISLLRHRLTY